MRHVAGVAGCSRPAAGCLRGASAESVSGPVLSTAESCSAASVPCPRTLVVTTVGPLGRGCREHPGTSFGSNTCCGRSGLLAFGRPFCGREEAVGVPSSVWGACAPPCPPPVPPRCVPRTPGCLLLPSGFTEPAGMQVARGRWAAGARQRLSGPRAQLLPRGAPQESPPGEPQPGQAGPVQAQPPALAPGQRLGPFCAWGVSRGRRSWFRALCSPEFSLRGRMRRSRNRGRPPRASVFRSSMIYLFFLGTATVPRTRRLFTFPRSQKPATAFFFLTAETCFSCRTTRPSTGRDAGCFCPGISADTLASVPLTARKHTVPASLGQRRPTRLCNRTPSD